jgi:glycosyltransferase involved in cell wall biosynthesis
MVRHQIREGVEAEILTSNDDGPNVLKVPTGSFLRYEGARVCFLSRRSPSFKPLREFQYSSDSVPWLKHHLSDYDCLHVHGLFSHLSTLTMQLARQKGTPFISRPLGQLHPWSLRQSAFKKRLYLALIERANLAGAAAIHCTSEQEAEHVRSLLLAAKTAVIPHGVEPGVAIPEAALKLRKTYGIRTDGYVILFLSRWHGKKNIPVLLQALQGLRHLPWTLILAGNTDDSQLAGHVRQLVQRQGLSERVICPGHVKGIAKEILLQGVNLFVLPSASENFGIAVAEALVNGLPVCITPGVDLAETVKILDGGMVCEPDPVSLSACLQQMMSDDHWSDLKRRLQIRDAARACFSWTANALALKQLYASIVQTTSR